MNFTWFDVLLVVMIKHTLYSTFSGAWI